MLCERASFGETHEPIFAVWRRSYFKTVMHASGLFLERTCTTSAPKEASTMKFFAFVLSLQTLSSHYCNGFSYSASSSQRAVAGLSNPSTSLKSVNINEQEEYANAMSIRIASSTTLALGLWAMSASPSLASHPMNPAAASSQSSSSFVVAADYSSSDFADFSLPSYKDALTSPINANLKGDKQLLGEEESSASSSSTR